MPTCELCGQVVWEDQESRNNDEGVYHVECLDDYFEDAKRQAITELARARVILQRMTHHGSDTVDQALDAADRARERDQ